MIAELAGTVMTAAMVVLKKTEMEPDQQAYGRSARERLRRLSEKAHRALEVPSSLTSERHL